MWTYRQNLRRTHNVGLAQAQDRPNYNACKYTYWTLSGLSLTIHMNTTYTLYIQPHTWEIRRSIFYKPILKLRGNHPLPAWHICAKAEPLRWSSLENQVGCKLKSSFILRNSPYPPWNAHGHAGTVKYVDIISQHVHVQKPSSPCTCICTCIVHGLHIICSISSKVSFKGGGEGAQGEASFPTPPDYIYCPMWMIKFSGGACCQPDPHVVL